MLKTLVMFTILMMLPLNTSVNACEVGVSKTLDSGQKITDFKPCGQNSCPIYQKYRELEILIEVEFTDYLTEEELKAKAAQKDFVNNNTRIRPIKKVIYGKVSKSVNYPNK